MVEVIIFVMPLCVLKYLPYNFIYMQYCIVTLNCLCLFLCTSIMYSDHSSNSSLMWPDRIPPFAGGIFPPANGGIRSGHVRLSNSV